MMESEWSNNRVLALLEDIRLYPCLWDPKDKDYKNKTEKFNCLKILSVKYKCTSDEVKKKWTNLLQVYRSCRRKIKCAKRSGDDVYKPLWFAFDYMNSFMADVYVPYGNSESMNEEKEEEVNEDDIEIVINEENIETDEIRTKEITYISMDDQQLKKKVFLSPKKSLEIKKKKRQLKTTIDERAEETYAYLVVKKKKEEPQEKKQKNECEIFGELVTAKLRNFDHYTRQIVMNDINNIIFRAIMQTTRVLQSTQYNTFSQSPQESPIYSCSSLSSPAASHSPLSPISFITTQSTSKILQSSPTSPDNTYATQVS